VLADGLSTTALVDLESVPWCFCPVISTAPVLLVVEIHPFRKSINWLKKALSFPVTNGAA